MKKLAIITVTVFLSIKAASADPDNDSLIINDDIQLVTETAAPIHLENLDTIYSGWRFRTDETQALQVDDFDNPAMVFVDKAIDLFNTIDGIEGKACVSCHESVAQFRGLSAIMPKVIDGELVVLESFINDHRDQVMEQSRGNGLVKRCNLWWHSLDFNRVECPSMLKLMARRDLTGSKARKCIIHGSVNCSFLVLIAMKTTTEK